VKLCKDLTFTRYVIPILLPARKFVVPNSANVIVAGWGDTKEDGVVSAILQKVHLRKINFSACKKIYSSITKGHICAGVMKGGKDSCDGD
jgi:trypsin